jgi:hypothetical protein
MHFFCVAEFGVRNVTLQFVNTDVSVSDVEEMESSIASLAYNGRQLMAYTLKTRGKIQTGISAILFILFRLRWDLAERLESCAGVLNVAGSSSSYGSESTFRSDLIRGSIT